MRRPRLWIGLCDSQNNCQIRTIPSVPTGRIREAILRRIPLEWNRSDLTWLCGIFRFHAYALCREWLPAYMKSSKKIFDKNAKYVRHIHLAGKRDRGNNDKMERLNGEIMDRKKVFKGLKRLYTPLIDWLKAYYNFTKKRGSLKDRIRHRLQW